jgi:predicted  nucleic acid-binding Zn-ribbon protein
MGFIMGTSNNIDVDVALVRQETHHNANLIHKLDVAIEKITQTNHNIEKMLAIHEERIERIEKNGAETTIQVERRSTQLRDEMNHIEFEISRKIDDSETRVKKSISDIKDEIKSEIEKNKDNSDTTTSSLRHRVEALEKWRWILTGGAVVLAVVVPKLDIVSKVFKIFSA